MADEHPAGVSTENVDQLLTGLRQEANAWDTSPGGSREHELHAAALVARFQTLDHALSHGGNFPMPWCATVR